MNLLMQFVVWLEIMDLNLIQNSNGEAININHTGWFNLRKVM